MVPLLMFPYIRLRRIAAGSGLIMLMVGPPMHLWSVVSMTKGRIFHKCSCNQRKGTDQYEKNKYFVLEICIMLKRKLAQIMLVVIFILAVIIYRTLASIYLFRSV